LLTTLPEDAAELDVLPGVNVGVAFAVEVVSEEAFEETAEETVEELAELSTDPEDELLPPGLHPAVKVMINDREMIIIPDLILIFINLILSFAFFIKEKVSA
jgi:hypothetical protein